MCMTNEEWHMQDLHATQYDEIDSYHYDTCNILSWDLMLNN